MFINVPTVEFWSIYLLHKLNNYANIFYKLTIDYLI